MGAAGSRRALPKTGTVTVRFTPGRPANTFVPSEALGGCVDGHEEGDADRIYTPENLRAMLSAGLKPLTYRLRTELGIAVWHWNPKGAWSDPRRGQGYWTSDARSDAPITVSYGYRLPRRGNTLDQAQNDGYSRLDDGDAQTFWKSNPYLDRRYTGEDNARHPQWIVLDLGKKVPVNALRLLWGAPYATRYQVRYWLGPSSTPAGSHRADDWRTFAGGVVERGTGGETFLRLSRSPVAARFVQVSMTASSGTAPRGSQDARDGLGYAVREAYLGTVDRNGRFHDALRHAPKHDGQTVAYVSSTDPWHRSVDRDPRIEQPGFDRVFRSGLTNGLPMLTPVGLLYETPENSVAQMRFLKARGYPVRQVEMGEEPDGQLVEPEDYGALYLQWADALHRADPSLQLGGPCFQTTQGEARDWPDRPGSGSWFKRFLGYLRSRGRMKDYAFFSFEWYPFDDIGAPTAPQLAAAPGILKDVLTRLQSEGLSREIPWMVTEYGYSAFAGQAEVDREGALMNADTVGLFLSLGGDAAYLFGYEPSQLLHGRHGTWGQNMLFLTDEDGRAKYHMATYYGARLLTQEWAQPSGGAHQVYPASADIRNRAGQDLVTAYAVHRPDGKWAVMLINKDPGRTCSIRVRFADGKGKEAATLKGPADAYQLSSAQYVWHPHGQRGYPRPERPAEHTVVTDLSGFPFRLPPYSLTVIRGDAG
jgi:hypothetical protein